MPSIRRTERTPKACAGALGKIVGILFALLVLLGVELLLRVTVREDHLDQILAVLKRDPVLFWRNRPNLATTFAGTDVFTEKRGLRVAAKGERISPRKEPGVLRILCLGGSPTFGWGEPYAGSYSARLETLLREAGVPAEVINAGMIGYSSHQGKQLLRNDLLELAPDIVFAAYVINDIDRYRFYRSNGLPDRTLAPENPLVVGLLNVLDRSSFVHLYGRVLGSLVGGRGAVQGRPVEIYRPLSVRVPPEDYRANMIDIAEIAAERGARPIFIKMPVNLPVAADPPAEAAAEAEALRARGTALAESGACDEALPVLERAAGLNPNLSDVHYFIGKCRLRQGDAEGARLAFDAAMKSEAHRCGRDGLLYNEVLEDAARERGVPWVDAAASFRAVTDRYLFQDPDEDPIHPNAEGHEIIARLLLEALNTETNSPAR